MARCRFAVLLAISLGCFNASAAEPEDCKDCFGLSAPPTRETDYSYAPLLDSKPFGERNCGTTTPQPIEPALLKYAPFQSFITGTWPRWVVFEGSGENALKCLILLARVQEKRSASEAGGHKPKPTWLYKWKQLLLKYDPRTGTKLIWIPVTPNAEEQIDPTYLERTAKRLLSSLGTPLEELQAQRVQLTTGFGGAWVTLTLSKDQTGAVVQTVMRGMGSPLSLGR